MNEPYWFSRDEILGAHQMSLVKFGGLDGIRDENMLESSQYKPQQLFGYGNPSIFDLAASYAFGIIKNHPFVDGNKRTGYMLAVGFLGRNNYSFLAPEIEVVLNTLAMAAGELDEAGYASWLKKNSSKIK